MSFLFEHVFLHFFARQCPSTNSTICLLSAVKEGLYRIWCGVHTLSETSAFVNPAGQLLLTRRGKTRMDSVGILFEFKCLWVASTSFSDSFSSLLSWFLYSELIYCVLIFCVIQLFFFYVFHILLNLVKKHFVNMVALLFYARLFFIPEL